MRICELTLLKYGRFDDRQLVFPAPAPGRTDTPASDLHIVVGPNEAGKSTFRNAVVDFLFGFPLRTPFGFRFEMSQLAVAATVETTDGPRELVRLKKSRDDLRGADGAVADAGLLAAALAGLDRAAFEREQAIGHDELMAGGKTLLDNKEDLSAQLFGAATGLGRCVDHHKAVAARASGLFAFDGRTKTEWREAKRAFDTAAKAVRGAETRKSAFERLLREVRSTDQALAGERRARDELRVRKGRVERLVRLAPQVARLAALSSSIEDLSKDGALPHLLPEDATDRVRAARETLAVQQNAIAVAARELEARQARLDGLSVDDGVLAAEDEIVRLAERAVVVANQADDIIKRRAEIDGKRRQAIEEARGIGRTATDAQALADGLPNRSDRAELRDVAASRDGLGTRAAELAEEIDGADARIRTIVAALEALPATTDTSELRAALAGAAALGDVAQNRQPLVIAIDGTVSRRDMALKSLAPWEGPVEALAGIAPPEPAAYEAADAERRRLTDEIRRLEERIEDRSAQRLKAAAALDVRVEAGSVPDAAALARARTDRDAVWRDIRSGERSPADAAEAFEAAIATADRIADARFVGAQEATLLEKARAEIAGTAAEEAELARQARERKARLEELHAAWKDRLASHGLGEVPFEGVPDWLRRREDALAAAREAAEAAAALGDFDRRVASALSALAAALPDGVARPVADDLAPWRSVAEMTVSAADETATRRRDLGERLREAEDARSALRKRADEVATDRAGLSGRWMRLTAACGLPEDAGMERVRVTLEALERIDDLLAEADRIGRERVETMERDRTLFTTIAAALAAKVAPALAQAAPADIARSLSASLASAREAASEGTRLRGAIADAEGAMADGQDRISAALAGLAPLFATAGLAPSDDLARLADAAERSDALRRLLDQRRIVEEAIAADSDGQPLEEVVAAVADGDPDERRREIGEIDAALAEADDRFEAATEAAIEAHRALEAVTGGTVEGSPVTDAAADKARAAGRLAEIAADHLWAYAEARLMRWAIDRYRVENQSPLVAHAGALFAGLTCGRYSGLDADVTEATPRLLAIEAESGSGLTVDALSSGTRDQLFLALRLAAADLRAEAGRRLPFVADDLFVNADDARTEAGLKILAELATRTQIIYLTHHEHLVAIARSALGETVNVVRL